MKRNDTIKRKMKKDKENVTKSKKEILKSMNRIIRKKHKSKHHHSGKKWSYWICMGYINIIIIFISHIFNGLVYILNGDCMYLLYTILVI